MATKTQTVHFSVGEDMGILLAEIAQEHLIYNYNPKKAVEAITESLRGADEELALQVIKGDVVLIVDVEEQQVIPMKRIAGIHNEFPQLDISAWYKRNLIEMTESGKSLSDNLKHQIFNNSYNRNSISIDSKSVMMFVAGNKEAFNDMIYNLETVSYLTGLVKLTKDYIEKSLKLKATMDWMYNKYPEEFDDMYISDLREYGTILMSVSDELRRMLDGNILEIDEDDAEETGLTNYIEAAIEIGKVLSNGIEPVNILDNYSAGWLSPVGLYYGLNGEIANMLHNQIANALQENGTIPLVDDNGNEISPDVWLEQRGWVKIHGNNVNFAGCLNKKIGMTNVQLTNVQKAEIYKYIQTCHKGLMLLGWRQEPISAAKFDMMSGNLIMINKYFEY